MTDPTIELPHPDHAYPVVTGYRIEALAGSGGMARVFRAVEEGLERPVAIKVLCAHGSDQVAQRTRFEREARLVAALQHPGIVSIFRITRTRDGDPCIVMPWLQGSLADRPLPLREAQARELLDGLLDALAHAHAAQIVHRDIKPDNVLFDASQRPLLADFGVALRVGSDARLTGEGLAVGSARYMSPEQALGREVDARSDLYSMGVLACEVLTGAPPYPATDAIAAALAHVEAPLPTLPLALAHWQDWLDRALAKNPDHRFADAQDMRAALPAGVAELRFVPARRSKGNRWGLWAAGTALLFAMAWWWWPATSTAIDPALNTGAAEPALTPNIPNAAPLPALAQPAPPTTPGARYPRIQDEVSAAPWLVQLSQPDGRVLTISQTEITRGQYAAFADASGRSSSSCKGGSWQAPGFAQDDEHPVSCVSFADAQAYASWLSARTGKRYRLPTLAELQGLSTPLRDRTGCAQAQLGGDTCARTGTAPVEAHPASADGVFGLVGNVREWTRDCSWRVEKANPVAHGLRGVGRWIQRKEPVARETRTCIGRKIAGSGYADQQPWPAPQIHAESTALPDLGFRLVRD